MVVQIGTCLVFALTTLCFPKTQKPKNLGALRSPVAHRPRASTRSHA